MSALSTELRRAHGETTSSGSRGPYPHRSWKAPAAAVPQWPGPVRASFAGSFDWLTIGGITWSYQPSESS